MKLFVLLITGLFVAVAPCRAADEKTAIDAVALCERVKPAFVFISGGSGVVISPDGTLLTNHHVIGNQLEFDVRLGNGQFFRAKVLGKDVTGDLAALQLQLKPDEKVPYLELGDHDKILVGDPVIAVGNPFGIGLFDYQPTFSQGIISSLNQSQGSYTDSIITDASINPGNSGGPLIDREGRVIGINGQINTRFGFRSNTGLGVAISARRIHIWLPLLQKAKGGVVRHGRLPGIELESSEVGLLGMPKVKEVVEDSPAAKAGLQAGDRIVKFDGQSVPNVARLAGLIASYPENIEVPFDVERAGQTVSLKATLIFPRKGDLGFKLGKPGDKDEFVKITEVAKDSAAAKAGFVVGDEIVGIEEARLAMPVKRQFAILDAWQKNGVLAFQPVNIRVRRQKDTDDKEKKESEELKLRIIPK